MVWIPLTKFGLVTNSACDHHSRVGQGNKLHSIFTVRDKTQFGFGTEIEDFNVNEQ